MAEQSVPPGGLVVRRETDQWILEPDATVTIGRSTTCTVTIDNDHVSRQHLELVSVDGVWSGRDMGTLNGTFVEGEPATSFQLTDFTVIVIGGVEGAVLTFEPEPASPPADDPDSRGTVIVSTDDIEAIEASVAEQPADDPTADLSPATTADDPLAGLPEPAPAAPVAELADLPAPPVAAVVEDLADLPAPPVAAVVEDLADLPAPPVAAVVEDLADLPAPPGTDDPLADVPAPPAADWAAPDPADDLADLPAPPAAAIVENLADLPAPPAAAIVENLADLPAPPAGDWAAPDAVENLADLPAPPAAAIVENLADLPAPPAGDWAAPDAVEDLTGLPAPPPAAIVEPEPIPEPEPEPEPEPVADALPEAGWYADAYDATQERFWTGAEWAEQWQPIGTAAAGAAPLAVEAEPAPVGLPPADWYPDPDDPSRQRYWDGQLWTDHYHPPLT